MSFHIPRENDVILILIHNVDITLQYKWKRYNVVIT